MLFNLTVNSSQEDTQELVTIAAVLKDLVRVQTPDSETRLKIVSNTINVVANMEGWEVSSGKAVLIIPTSQPLSSSGPPEGPAPAHRSGPPGCEGQASQGHRG